MCSDPDAPFLWYLSLSWLNHCLGKQRHNGGLLSSTLIIFLSASGFFFGWEAPSSMVTLDSEEHFITLTISKGFDSELRDLVSSLGFGR